MARCILILIFSTISIAIEYNDQEARLMFDLSTAALTENPMICVNRVFPSDDWKLTTDQRQVACDAYNDTCSCYAIVSDTRREIIIACRGTNSFRQFLVEGIQSLQSNRIWEGPGLVDRYFLTAADRVWQLIEPTLVDIRWRDYVVTFTGHSLGGAISSVSAMRSIIRDYRKPNQIKLITFGEPRVGNPEYARAHDRMIAYSYRVVHKADLIPHLPPCKSIGASCDRFDLGRSYHHSTEIWYNNDMHPGAPYYVCSADGEDPSCSNGLSSFKYKPTDHVLYFGHNIDKYSANGCVDSSSNTITVQWLLIMFAFWINLFQTHMSTNN